MGRWLLQLKASDGRAMESKASQQLKYSSPRKPQCYIFNFFCPATKWPGYSNEFCVISWSCERSTGTQVLLKVEGSLLPREKDKRPEHKWELESQDSSPSCKNMNFALTRVLSSHACQWIGHNLSQLTWKWVMNLKNLNHEDTCISCVE